MISWLQNNMQRHYKWLFSGLLIIIIVAFVFTIGNTGGLGSSNPQDIKLNFFGVNLNSPQEYGPYEEAAMLSAQLNQQRMRSREDLNAAALQRITALHLVNELSLPAPTTDQLGQFIREIPAFIDPQKGSFSPDRYTSQLDRAKNNPSIGEDGFIRVITEDYLIDQVIDALGGPGYVLPYMAKRQLEVMDTKWSIEVATLEKSTFKPELTPADEDLKGYYDNNSFRYASGPQIVLNYILVPASKYMDEIEDPSNAQQLNFYRTHRQQMTKGEDGQPLPLSDNRDEVIQLWKKEQAKEKALEEANHITVAAYEANYAKKLSDDLTSIKAFAEQTGYSLEAVPAFPRANPPADIPGIPQAALAQAADLNDKRFYSDGVAVDDGAAVFFLVEELDSTTPDYDEVKDAVLADYSEEQTNVLYNERSQQIKDELQAAVSDGQAFAEKAKELGLDVETFSDFTLSNPPRSIDYFVLSVLGDMKAGEVSDLLSMGGSGTFIYVVSKDSPEFSTDSEEVQNNMKELVTYSSRATAQGILNEMMIAEEERITPEEF